MEDFQCGSPRICLGIIPLFVWIRLVTCIIQTFMVYLKFLLALQLNLAQYGRGLQLLQAPRTAQVRQPDLGILKRYLSIQPVLN